jgi:hypothetical protein
MKSIAVIISKKSPTDNGLARLIVHPIMGTFFGGKILLSSLLK